MIGKLITKHIILQVKQLYMKFTRLVPNVFYENIKDGLALFVDCLGFAIAHKEFASQSPFCVIDKDGLQMMLFESKEYAEQHSPEFRLVTDNIEEVYAKVSASHPQLLHPNLSQITLRPWGAKEFALMDHQVGIIIQQWL